VWLWIWFRWQKGIKKHSSQKKFCTFR
jgi:hypothetical protein